MPVPGREGALHSEQFPNQMECKILVRPKQLREESTACVQVIYHHHLNFLLCKK